MQDFTQARRARVMAALATPSSTSKALPDPEGGRFDVARPPVRTYPIRHLLSIFGTVRARVTRGRVVLLTTPTQQQHPPGDINKPCRDFLKHFLRVYAYAGARKGAMEFPRSIAPACAWWWIPRHFCDHYGRMRHARAGYRRWNHSDFFHRYGRACRTHP